jgi:Fic family protein
LEGQAAYYQALSASDKAGDATIFIEFALTTIRDSLAQLMEQIRTKPLTTKDRLEIASSRFGNKSFSRKDYLIIFKSISSATGSRDLLVGVQSGELKKDGEKALTRYSFSKAT